MRVIMMGTGPFAVPTLRALYASPHQVLALFTRPPRVIHGKTREQANPMRALAVEHGTPVHEPESINEPAARMVLASYQSELFVVCDYGQILAPSTLEIARFGGINLHASLLPRYRGAAPINWAIYNGETETGVTVIHMTPRVDAGPAIAQAKTAIGAEETAAQLEPRLAEIGAPLVVASIDRLETGTAQPLDQDPALATRAPRLSKELGLVDWSRPASALANQVRALEPWPKTYTFWQRAGGERLRLILDRVRVESRGDAIGATPGTVLDAQGARLVVAAGQDALVIESLQPAGKRVLATDEFLRGYAVRSGERFGS
jgi:methionyl-tRNA formyltransferase